MSDIKYFTLITSIPGRTEKRSLRSVSSALTFDELRRKIGKAWGFDSVDDCVLLWHGKYLLASENEWQYRIRTTPTFDGRTGVEVQLRKDSPSHVQDLMLPHDEVRYKLIDAEYKCSTLTSENVRLAKAIKDKAAKIAQLEATKHAQDKEIAKLKESLNTANALKATEVAELKKLNEAQAKELAALKAAASAPSVATQHVQASQPQQQAIETSAPKASDESSASLLERLEKLEHRVDNLPGTAPQLFLNQTTPRSAPGTGFLPMRVSSGIAPTTPSTGSKLLGGSTFSTTASAFTLPRDSSSKSQPQQPVLATKAPVQGFQSFASPQSRHFGIAPAASTSAPAPANTATVTPAPQPTTAQPTPPAQLTPQEMETLTSALSQIATGIIFQTDVQPHFDTVLTLASRIVTATTAGQPNATLPRAGAMAPGFSLGQLTPEQMHAEANELRMQAMKAQHDVLQHNMQQSAVPSSRSSEAEYEMVEGDADSATTQASTVTLDSQASLATPKVQVDHTATSSGQGNAHEASIQVEPHAEAGNTHAA